MGAHHTDREHCLLTVPSCSLLLQFPGVADECAGAPAAPHCHQPPPAAENAATSSAVHSKLLLAARGHREGHRALEVQQQAISLAIQQLPLDHVHLLPSEAQAQYFAIMQQLAENKNQTQRCGPPPLPSLVLDTAGHATQQDMKRKHESLGSTNARVKQLDSETEQKQLDSATAAEKKRSAANTAAAGCSDYRGVGWYKRDCKCFNRENHLYVTHVRPC